MYKTAVRWLIRRNIRALNSGRFEPALAMFAADADLTFPGDNTWSRQYREPRAGRTAFPTHKGRAEIESFLRRYTELGIQMEVEDILVNGPPWHTRPPVRAHTRLSVSDVLRRTANHAVPLVRPLWGTPRRQAPTQRP
mgnify:CR=1 FL=1